MILKKIIYDVKRTAAMGFLFLALAYAYFVFVMVYSFFNGITDYISAYTSNLFVSFALSCIACRDLGLKIIRFDFQFRMTFVYLVLVLISELTVKLSSVLYDNIIKYTESVSDLIFISFPNMQYELSYEGPIGIVLESFLYGLFSPFIYSFACLCFSMKKMKSIAIANLLLGTFFFLINGIVFGSLGLLVQVETDLYLYSPFFAVYYLILILLSYVVGKNSFVENAA